MNSVQLEHMDEMMREQRSVPLPVPIALPPPFALLVGTRGRGTKDYEWFGEVYGDHKNQKHHLYTAEQMGEYGRQCYAAAPEPAPVPLQNCVPLSDVVAEFTADPAMKEHFDKARIEVKRELCGEPAPAQNAPFPEGVDYRSTTPAHPDEVAEAKTYKAAPAQPEQQSVPKVYIEPGCAWDEDEDGNWETDCGEIHVLIEGTPFENDMAFCCYCGKNIEQRRYQEAEVAPRQGDRRTNYVHPPEGTERALRSAEDRRDVAPAQNADEQDDAILGNNGIKPVAPVSSAPASTPRTDNFEIGYCSISGNEGRKEYAISAYAKLERDLAAKTAELAEARHKLKLAFDEDLKMRALKEQEELLVEAEQRAERAEQRATAAEAALKKLAFAAMISGGVAGRDETLCAAIDEATKLLEGAHK